MIQRKHKLSFQNGFTSSRKLYLLFAGSKCLLDQPLRLFVLLCLRSPASCIRFIVTLQSFIIFIDLEAPSTLCLTWVVPPQNGDFLFKYEKIKSYESLFVLTECQTKLKRNIAKSVCATTKSVLQKAALARHYLKGDVMKNLISEQNKQLYQHTLFRHSSPRQLLFEIRSPTSSVQFLSLHFCNFAVM